MSTRVTADSQRSSDFRGSGRSATRRGRKAGVVLAGAVVAAISVPALAGPKGERVQAGSAQFLRQGNHTTIRTSQNAIINYDSFNLSRNESVRFAQPNAASRVLNRITGAAPTVLNGRISANGTVYFVNPAGVYFGPNSVINVGSIYAAAGNISNQDFLSGVDRFTDIAGEVVNEGTIRAINEAHLIGRRVANSGSVIATDGMVTFSAGEDVLIGRRDGHVFARIVPTEGGGDRVENSGTIDAGRGRVLLGAGDYASLALMDDSIVRGGDVRVEGGDASTVDVSGLVTARNRGGESHETRTGGRVDILGGTVNLDGATVDASGTFGGGDVHIGGDYQGKGDLRTSDATSVSFDSSIRVDALRSGDGGEAIVWSDGHTDFGGFISARGGRFDGDGGFAEISGKLSFDLSGTADLRSPMGTKGELLLDPFAIEVIAAGGTATVIGDVDSFGGGVTTLDLPTLLSFLGVGDVTLRADDSITFSTTVPYFGASSLTVEAGRLIEIAAGRAVVIGGGFRAIVGVPGASPAAGNGGFIMGDGSAVGSTMGDIRIDVLNMPQGIGSLDVTRVLTIGVNTTVSLSNMDLDGTGIRVTPGLANNLIYGDNYVIQTANGDAGGEAPAERLRFFDPRPGDGVAPVLSGDIAGNGFFRFNSGTAYEIGSTPATVFGDANVAQNGLRTGGDANFRVEDQATFSITQPLDVGQTLVFDIGNRNAQLGEAADGLGNDFELTTAELTDANLTFGGLSIQGGPSATVRIEDDAAGSVFAKLSGLDLILGDASRQISNVIIQSQVAGGADLLLNDLIVDSTGTMLFGTGVRSINAQRELNLSADGGITTAFAGPLFTFTTGIGGITINDALASSSDLLFELNGLSPVLGAINAAGFDVSFTTSGLLRVGSGAGSGNAAAQIDSATVAGITSATLGFTSTGDGVEFADDGGALVAALTGRDVTADAMGAGLSFFGDGAGVTYSFDRFTGMALADIAFGGGVSGLTTTNAGGDAAADLVLMSGGMISFAQDFTLTASGDGSELTGDLDAGLSALTLAGDHLLAPVAGANATVTTSSLTIEDMGSLTLGGGATTLTLDIDDLALNGTGSIDAGANTLRLISSVGVEIGETAALAGDGLEIDAAEFGNLTFGTLAIQADGQSVDILDNAAGDVFAGLAGRGLQIGTPTGRASSVSIASNAGGATLGTTTFGALTTGDFVFGPGVTGATGAIAIDIATGTLQLLDPGGFTFNAGGVGALTLRVTGAHNTLADDGDVRAQGGLTFGGPAFFFGVEKISTGLAAGDNNGGLTFENGITLDGTDMELLVDGTFTMAAGSGITGLAANGFLDITALGYTLDAADGSIVFPSGGTIAWRGPSLTALAKMVSLGQNVTNLIFDATNDSGGAATDLLLLDMQNAFSGFTGQTNLLATRDVIFDATAADANYLFGGPVNIVAGRDLNFEANVSGIELSTGALTLNPTGVVNVRGGDSGTGDFTFTADDGIAGNFLDIRARSQILAAAGSNLVFNGATQIEGGVETAGGSMTFTQIARILGDLTAASGSITFQQAATLGADVAMTLSGTSAGELIDFQQTLMAEANQDLTLNLADGGALFQGEVGDTASDGIGAADLGLVTVTGDGTFENRGGFDASAFLWDAGTGTTTLGGLMRLTGQIDPGTNVNSFEFTGSTLSFDGGSLQTVGAGTGNVEINAMVDSTIGNDVLINVDATDAVLDLVGGAVQRGILTVNGAINASRNIDLRADLVELLSSATAGGGIRLDGTAGVERVVQIGGDLEAGAAFDGADPLSRAVIVMGDALLNGNVRSLGAGDAIHFDSRLSYGGDFNIVSNGGNIVLQDVLSFGGRLFARTDNNGGATGGDIFARDIRAATAAASNTAAFQAFTDGGNISLRNVGSVGADGAAAIAGGDGFFELAELALEALSGTIFFEGISYDARSMTFVAGDYEFDTDPSLAVSPILGRIVTFGDGAGTSRTAHIEFQGGTINMAGLDLLVFNALGQTGAGDNLGLATLTDTDGMTGGDADALRTRSNLRSSFMGSDAVNVLGDVLIATDELTLNGMDIFAATIQVRPFDDNLGMTLGDGVAPVGLALSNADVGNLRGTDVLFGGMEPDAANDPTAAFGAYNGQIVLGDVTFPSNSVFRTGLNAADAILVADSRVAQGTNGLTFDGLLTLGTNATLLGGGGFIDALREAEFRDDSSIDTQGGDLTLRDAIRVARNVSMASQQGDLVIEGTTNALGGILDASLELTATNLGDGRIEIFTVGDMDRLGTLTITGREILFDGTAYRTFGTQSYTATGNGGPAFYLVRSSVSPNLPAVFDSATGSILFDDANNAELRLGGNGFYGFFAGSDAGFGPGADFFAPRTVAIGGTTPFLNVTADGRVTFTGAIGSAANPFGTITISGSNLVLNGATSTLSQIFDATGADGGDDDIRTAGAFAVGNGRLITFDGRVLLTGATTATATGGAISLGGLGEDAGPSSLTLDTGTGRIIFTGDTYNANTQRYTAATYELRMDAAFSTTAPAGVMTFGPAGQIVLGGFDFTAADGFGGSQLTFAQFLSAGGEQIAISTPGLVSLNGVTGTGLATLDLQTNVLQSTGTIAADDVILRTFGGRNISVGDRINGTFHVSQAFLDALRPGASGATSLQIGESGYNGRVTIANANFGRMTSVLANGGGFIDFFGPSTSDNGAAILADADTILFRNTLNAANGDAFDVTFVSPNAVLIDGNAAINTAGGAFTAGNIDGFGFGRGDLMIDTGAGLLTVGQIGVGNRVASAMLSTDGVLSLTDVRSTGSQSLTGSRIDLLGGMFLAGGGSTIAFNGPASVLGAVDVLVGGGGAANAVTFADAITGTGSAGETLVIGVGPNGNAVLQAVGSADPTQQIESLDVNGGTVDLFGDLFTTASIVLDAAANARTADLTLASDSVEIRQGIDAPDVRTNITIDAADTLLLGASGDAGRLGDLTILANGGQAEFDGSLFSDGNVAFGNEMLASGSIEAVGRISFLEALRVANELRVESTGATADAGIRFASTVDGDGNGAANDRLVAIADRSRGSLLENDTVDGDVPVIGFLDDVGQLDALGTLDLNFDPTTGVDGRAFVPVNATIVFGDPENPDLSVGRPYNIEVGTFRMGAREALVTLGDFLLNAFSPNTARLSDITALGDIIVTSPSVQILAREGGSKFDPTTGQIIPDTATDFVAGGIIDIGTITSIIQLAPGAADPEFALPTGNAAITSQAGLFLSKAFGDEVGPLAGIPVGGRTVLLDVRSDGPTNTNVSEAIAGAVPRDPEPAAVEADATIDAAARNALSTLGVPLADEEDDRVEADPSAIIDNLEYDIESLDPRPGVTSRRLDRETVSDVVAESNRMLFETVAAGEQGAAEPRSLIEDIKLLIEDVVLDAYDNDAVAQQIGDDVLTADVFAQYLCDAGTPEAGQVRELVIELRRVATGLNRLGLSPTEFERVRSQGVIYSGLIESVNQELPPAEWQRLLEDSSLDLGCDGQPAPADAQPAAALSQREAEDLISLLLGVR